jgi:hypothetical protein
MKRFLPFLLGALSAASLLVMTGAYWKDQPVHAPRLLVGTERAPIFLNAEGDLCLSETATGLPRMVIEKDAANDSTVVKTSPEGKFLAPVGEFETVVTKAASIYMFDVWPPVEGTKGVKFSVDSKSGRMSLAQVEHQANGKSKVLQEFGSVTPSKAP